MPVTGFSCWYGTMELRITINSTQLRFCVHTCMNNKLFHPFQTLTHMDVTFDKLLGVTLFTAPSL